MGERSGGAFTGSKGGLHLRARPSAERERRGSERGVLMKAKRRVGRYQPSRSNGQTQSLTLGAGVYTYTYLQDPVTVVVVTTRQMLGPEVNNIMAITGI